MVHSFQAPNQYFTVELPVETVFVHAHTASNMSLCKDMVLDTVLVDIEQRRIDCAYRTSFAEELEISACQLRFIARHERAEQIAAAAACRTSQDKFIPIPPSLAAFA